MFLIPISAQWPTQTVLLLATLIAQRAVWYGANYLQSGLEIRLAGRAPASEESAADRTRNTVLWSWLAYVTLHT
jgi:ABC-type uncharacterized transport system permease subunit